MVIPFPSTFSGESGDEGRKKTLKPWMRVPAPTAMLRDPRKTIRQR
jgi:hypothetical protein